MLIRASQPVRLKVIYIWGVFYIRTSFVYLTDEMRFTTAEAEKDFLINRIYGNPWCHSFCHKGFKVSLQCLSKEN